MFIASAILNIHNLVHLFGTLILILEARFHPIQLFFLFLKSKLQTKKPTIMLKFISQILLGAMSLFNKKIEVSQQVDTFLTEVQGIADNFSGIVAGTYTSKTTGNAVLDGIISILLEFVANWYKTNPELVQNEVNQVITDITPIINQFMKDVEVANAPVPPQVIAPTNDIKAEQKVAAVAQAPVKISFLEEAKKFIDNILGQLESPFTTLDSNTRKSINMNATKIQASLQNHIDANPSNSAIIKTIMPTVGQVIEASSQPTGQSDPHTMVAIKKQTEVVSDAIDSHMAISQLSVANAAVKAQ